MQYATLEDSNASRLLVWVARYLLGKERHSTLYLLICTLVNWGLPIEDKSSCHISPIVVLFYDGRCNSITRKYMHIASNNLETSVGPCEIFHMSSLLDAQIWTFINMSLFLVPLEHIENLELNLAHDTGMRGIINSQKYLTFHQSTATTTTWISLIGSDPLCRIYVHDGFWSGTQLKFHQSSTCSKTWLPFWANFLQSSLVENMAKKNHSHFPIANLLTTMLCSC